MLAYCSSPNRSVASAAASRKRAERTFASIAAMTRPAAGKCWLTSVTICPVGTSVVETTATVRSWPAARSWVPSVATSESQPRYRSHSP